MKNTRQTILLLMVWILAFGSVGAQTGIEKSLVGTWDLQGALDGENGRGKLLPRQIVDCEPDYFVLAADHTAKEVNYNQNCEATENELQWRLEGDTLTIIRGEVQMDLHIRRIRGGRLIMGLPVRPGSEDRIYYVYRKRE